MWQSFMCNLRFQTSTTNWYLIQCGYCWATATVVMLASSIYTIDEAGRMFEVIVLHKGAVANHVCALRVCDVTSCPPCQLGYCYPHANKGYCFRFVCPSVCLNIRCVNDVYSFKLLCLCPL